MSNARTRKAASTPAEVSVPVSGVVAPVDFDEMRAAALAASESPDTAMAYASERLAEFNTLGSRRSVVASLAAWSLWKAGLLVESNTLPGDAVDGAMSLKTYGEFWKDSGKGKASSPASVRTWIRAGQAMFDWGLAPESPEATALLGGLAQSSVWTEARGVLQAAQAKEGAEPITPERITAIVADAKVAEDKRKAAAPKRKSPEPKTGEPTTPLGKVQAALAGLSKEEMHAVLAEAMAWVDSESEVVAGEVVAEGDAA